MFSGFASYAFNKSHSAGYAILVMQTAWLKAHYPHEYMAAVLTSYTGKTDKDRSLRFGVPSRRYPDAVARCQRVRYRVHGYQGGRALWSGRHPRRGYRRGRRRLLPSARRAACLRRCTTLSSAWTRARLTAA